MSDEFPREKRKFDYGGFVFPKDSLAIDIPKHSRHIFDREVQWRCPNCGGDCFGTSMGTRHCHGHSYGTATEQSQPCGYWEDDFGNRGVT